jgi:8-oxo-dGTP pyrophosphatase MutT (NUDIX family)
VPIAAHIEALRALVGKQLLLLPGVAAIIRNGAGEVLLHTRSDDGRWSLPAGAIEPGESPAAAIVREVAEETGLRVRPERILGVFGGSDFRHVYPNGDAVEYTVIVFDCRVSGGSLDAVDGEALEFRWFPPAGIPALALPYPPALFDDAPERGTLFNRETAPDTSSP